MLLTFKDKSAQSLMTQDQSKEQLIWRFTDGQLFHDKLRGHSRGIAKIAGK